MFLALETGRDEREIEEGWTLEDVHRWVAYFRLKQEDEEAAIAEAKNKR